jgi:serine/threonine protein phosphatase 1
MREFVMADIHGHYDKLVSCLKAVEFDYSKDLLIQLGDVVDRGPDTFKCVEELLKIENKVLIRGNHDDSWFRSLVAGEPSQGLLWRWGAVQTYKSYLDAGVNPEVHFDFFKQQKVYYVDSKKRYFVHGGFNRHHPIEEQPSLIYIWDRDLWSSALSYNCMKEETRNKYPFKIYGKPLEVYIGHTPTTHWDKTVPMNCANIWNLDTGSGKGGLLTIMDINTKEYYQA